MESTASEMEMQEIEPDLFLAETVGPQSTAAPRAVHSPQYRFFNLIVEHNLKYLHVVCKLGILPFQVDVENRRVSPTNSKIRWGFFYFITFTSLLKVSYVDGILIASLLNPNWLDVLQLPVHLAIAITCSVVLIQLFLRPKSLRLSTVVLNAALAKRNQVKSLSLQQLVLAILPIGLTTIAAVNTFGFPLLTTISYQFGTLLRIATSEFNSEPPLMAVSPLVYGLLRVTAYAMDAFPAFWLSIGSIYLIISQALVPEVLHSWCGNLQVEPTRLSIAECYRELVDIQIIIGLFNHIYADVVFCFKALCFSVGILAFATVFWYGFSGNFVMCVINLYVGVICLMTYPLIFEKAALISGSMETAKKNLLIAMADFEDEQERAFWRRRIEAIRVVCYCCGPRPIERESLPLFYDFFFSTFIDVLLTT